MTSIDARYNYGNQWEIEYLPLDEFEEAQQMCDFEEEEEN